LSPLSLCLPGAPHQPQAPSMRSTTHDSVQQAAMPDVATQEQRGLLRTRKQLSRERTSHVQRVASFTSVLRPGTFLTCLEFPSGYSTPAASRRPSPPWRAQAAGRALQETWMRRSQRLLGRPIKAPANRCWVRFTSCRDPGVSPLADPRAPATTGRSRARAWRARTSPLLSVALDPCLALCRSARTVLADRRPDLVGDSSDHLTVQIFGSGSCVASITGPNGDA